MIYLTIFPFHNTLYGLFSFSFSSLTLYSISFPYSFFAFSLCKNPITFSMDPCLLVIFWWWEWHCWGLLVLTFLLIMTLTLRFFLTLSDSSNSPGLLMRNYMYRLFYSALQQKLIYFVLRCRELYLFPSSFRYCGGMKSASYPYRKPA